MELSDYAAVIDPGLAGLVSAGLAWDAAGPAVGVLLLLTGLVALLPDEHENALP